MVKADNLKSNSIEELGVLHVDAKKALFNLINEVKSTKKIEKPHLIRAKKKEIARILTVLREKELFEER